MAKIQFLVEGQKINRLTFIKEVEQVKYVRYGLFKCDCGKMRVTGIIRVKDGSAKSCGCLNTETRKRLIVERNTTHGLSANTQTRKIYYIIFGAKNRCYNQKNRGYHNYGGRGIGVYKQWLDNPDVFVKWALDNGYKEGLQLDRIDNNGNYEPNNCRFVTHQKNQNNKRDNIYFIYKGNRLTLTELASKYNIPINTFRGRHRRGWAIERMIESPIDIRFSKNK